MLLISSCIKECENISINKSDIDFNYAAQYFIYFEDIKFLTVFCKSVVVSAIRRPNLLRSSCLSSCSAFILCCFNKRMLSRNLLHSSSQFFTLLSLSYKRSSFSSNWKCSYSKWIYIVWEDISVHKNSLYFMKSFWWSATSGIQHQGYNVWNARYSVIFT